MGLRLRTNEILQDSRHGMQDKMTLNSESHTLQELFDLFASILAMKAPACRGGGGLRRADLPHVASLVR